VYSAGLCCAPIEPEILPKIKYEILHLDYFALLNAQHGHAAVLACPSLPIRKFNIPVDGDDVCSGQGKDVLDADVLNIELNSGELFKEIPKPAFDSALSPERATCVNFTRVDEDAVIPPSRHELGQVMLVHRLERASYGLFGNKSSDHSTLLSTWSLLSMD
jgi:hypothetical protein